MEKNKKLKYSDLDLSNDINNKVVFANLIVSDLAKVAVLAPLNIATGCFDKHLRIFEIKYEGEK